MDESDIPAFQVMPESDAYFLLAILFVVILVACASLVFASHPEDER